jgi:hypothetical protein
VGDTLLVITDELSCSESPTMFLCRVLFAFRQAIVSEHTNDGRWGAHAAAILAGTMWKPPRAGGHDDKAHPPIHPTRYSAGENDWSHGEALSAVLECDEGLVLAVVVARWPFAILNGMHHII